MHASGPRLTNDNTATAMSRQNARAAGLLRGSSVNVIVQRARTGSAWRPAGRDQQARLHTRAAMSRAAE